MRKGERVGINMNTGNRLQLTCLKMLLGSLGPGFLYANLERSVLNYLKHSSISCHCSKQWEKINRTHPSWCYVKWVSRILHMPLPLCKGPDTEVQSGQKNLQDSDIYTEIWGHKTTGHNFTQHWERLMQWVKGKESSGPQGVWPLPWVQWEIMGWNWVHGIQFTLLNNQSHTSCCVNDRWR